MSRKRRIRVEPGKVENVRTIKTEGVEPAMGMGVSSSGDAGDGPIRWPDWYAGDLASGYMQHLDGIGNAWVTVKESGARKIKEYAGPSSRLSREDCEKILFAGLVAYAFLKIVSEKGGDAA